MSNFNNYLLDVIGSKLNYIFAIIFLLFNVNLAAGQQAINGVVYDQVNHAPMVGANVKLASNLLASSLAATTNSEGRFIFSRLVPGEYQLTVQQQGFMTDSLLINLAPRAIQAVEFNLAINTNVQEVVEVKAGRLLLDETQGASIVVINQQFIDQLPQSRKTNLPDLISAFVPSAVSSHDNFVHLRGNELSLNTSINGVSFIDNPHQYFSPGLDPGAIQSFSVITGGFPAEYGNRFGGIIDAVTKSGFDSDGHGAITLGASTFLRDTVSAEYGGHTERFGYFLYGTLFQSQRFINPPQPQQLHDFGKGARTFAQFDYRAGNNDLFRLLLFNDGSNFQIPNTAADEQLGRNLFQRSREQTALFTWDHVISPRAQIVTSLFERLASTRLLPTADDISVQASGLRNDITVGARSDYTLTVNPRNTIKAGIELTGYRLREDFAFDPRDNDLEVPALLFRGRKSGGELGIYLQDKITVWKNFTANLGLRYDKYRVVTSEQQFSPRINLAYTFTRSNSVIHFAYNRLFAPPPIENLLLTTALSSGGRAPGAVKSNLYELGISQVIKGGLLMRLTTYYRGDKNSFELTELANVRQFLPTTFDRGKSYGVEFSLNLPEIPRLGISGYFNYTAQRAFQIGPISGGFSDEEVEPGVRGSAAFDQIHTGTAGITYQQHKHGFYSTFAFEYGSGTPKEDLRLPAHLVVNFYSGIDLFHKEKRQVSFQFNIENLTNRVFAIAKESEFTPVQFSSPRYFSGGLKISF